MGDDRNASQPAQPPPVVFVLEDDAAARGSMQRLLEADGYQASVFESVASFFNAFAIADPPPKCVVMDMHPPDGDGRDVATNLAKQYPGLPVILTSGKNIGALHVDALAVGAFAFFEKPLELSALFDAIARAVGL